jgi:hypothetical protein
MGIKAFIVLALGCALFALVYLYTGKGKIYTWSNKHLDILGIFESVKWVILLVVYELTIPVFWFCFNFVIPYITDTSNRALSEGRNIFCFYDLMAITIFVCGTLTGIYLVLRHVFNKMREE